MNQVNNRRNLLVAMLAIILAFVAMYMYFTAPAIEKKNARTKELAQKQQELKEYQQKIEKLTAAGPKEMVKLMQVRKQIPEQENVEELIRELHMLEVVTKAQMTGYAYDLKTAANQAQAQQQGQGAANAASPLVKNITMSPVVKGNYEQIYRLLQELQTSQRLITVNSITFSAAAAPPIKINVQQKELTCTLNLSAYFAPNLQRYFKTPIPVDYAVPSGRTNPIY